MLRPCRRENDATDQDMTRDVTVVVGQGRVVNSELVSTNRRTRVGYGGVGMGLIGCGYGRVGGSGWPVDRDYTRHSNATNHPLG